MIGDRDFHHQQQANSDLHFSQLLGQKQICLHSTRAIGDTLAIALDGTIKQTKFGTGIITCRRKPDADWAIIERID